MAARLKIQLHILLPKAKHLTEINGDLYMESSP